MISLDTEATGTDLRHGCRPFLVTTCNRKKVNTWWEWDVDPLTRTVRANKKDLKEIQEVIDDTDILVLQNSRFDFHGLDLLFQDYGLDLHWEWAKVRDTLTAGHLLASNHPHDLTSMALEYCDLDLQYLEGELERHVKASRGWVKDNRPKWRIARKGLEELPSVRGKVWYPDTWLPRVVAKEQGLSHRSVYWTVCSEYANGDSLATLFVYLEQRRELKKRGLWKIYLAALEVLYPTCCIEDNGVTGNLSRVEELEERYKRGSCKRGQVCIRIARNYGYELTLPKSGVNNSLRGFIFNKLGLAAIEFSHKTGNPSMNKSTLEHWEATEKCKPGLFVRSLRAKRRYDTSLTYLESYRRFMLPETRRDYETNTGYDDPVWFRLYPSLNPTGTHTLRFSSSNPNSQNFSKQEVEGSTLRYCLGPAPGREWWSLDAENIELRIPAYKAGEQEMIDLFERPNDGPYYGSVHLLMFDTLHPRRFAKHGKKVKEIYDSTWYQWTKNGDFAVQYGSVESSGTADRAYHVRGAFRKIKQRFRAIHGPGGLNEQLIAMAERLGYIETEPDKSVDPQHGYPLLCQRGRWGVKPTLPLNYYSSGTAMWWMRKAMIRVQEYLDTLQGYYMVMQVHDELVFDFPYGGKDPTRNRNLSRVREIQRLMEKGGEDIGIPTPVAITYHPNNWGEGIAI